jgi:hypothetical protein
VNAILCRYRPCQRCKCESCKRTRHLCARELWRCRRVCWQCSTVTCRIHLRRRYRRSSVVRKLDSDLMMLPHPIPYTKESETHHIRQADSRHDDEDDNCRLSNGMFLGHPHRVWGLGWRRKDSSFFRSLIFRVDGRWLLQSSRVERRRDRWNSIRLGLC